jgi:hypothetical protein
LIPGRNSGSLDGVQTAFSRLRRLAWLSRDDVESRISLRYPTLEECFLKVKCRFNKSACFDGNNDREPEAHSPDRNPRGGLSGAAKSPSTPGLRTLQGGRRFRSLHARDRLLNL